MLPRSSWACCRRAEPQIAQAGIVALRGLLAGASACVLLVMGGLGFLHTASIIAAAPFLLVMVGLCASLWIGLLDDIEVHGHFAEPRRRGEPRRSRQPANSSTAPSNRGGLDDNPNRYSVTCRIRLRRA